MKRIFKPSNLKSATRLTPLRLNALHFANAGAVITPNDFAAMAAASTPAAS